MEYTKLGNTGLDVSRICLGTMGFGTPGKGQFPWSIGQEDSKKIVEHALDLGINFFDTANTYSNGMSEHHLGNALKDKNRDELVVATKVFFDSSDKPNMSGLSRKAILSQIDRSLARLQMDYVDLYIIHRWDFNTPIEETMCALNDVVKSGKARYIGASAMYSWQFEKANAIAKANGFAQFVSMQDHLNLLYREEEREMLPLCEEENIAVTPYSPLASGRLARDWTASTKRAETDNIAKAKYDNTEAQDKIIVDRVGEIAQKHNVDRVQIALAWLLQKKQVVAPIVGATKSNHLDGAVKALDVTLTDEDIELLESPYLPHKLMGARTY
ncbi:aldo/keto reductase [Companilactobacillus allii]|uniref:Oxidoreductase n=1 Tax=Companilactobacillus allii TaxID=1847728 RepID=A0A1P8Q1M6_9LACO|nr:aldo/keto reductase [Companilactobacillus allii]APX71770.1 oxidoreductase [Companilactobacillus allii]USQ68857.1 aldo/keto reductase [Companilactobacillus allii]